MKYGDFWNLLETTRFLNHILCSKKSPSIIYGHPHPTSSFQARKQKNLDSIEKFWNFKRFLFNYLESVAFLNYSTEREGVQRLVAREIQIKNLI
jgi:hypothetical protein